MQENVSRTCQRCGARCVQRRTEHKNDWKRRKFCSRPCADASRRDQTLGKKMRIEYQMTTREVAEFLDRAVRDEYLPHWQRTPGSS